MKLVRSLVIRSLIFAVSASIVFASICLPQSVALSAINVSVITDEADALLTILAKRKANEPVVEADWQRLFSSEAYIRLKKREAAMRRPFEDTEFKALLVP